MNKIFSLLLLGSLILSNQGIAENKVPDFKFLNQNEESVTPEKMRGKFWVLNFFFTSCPSICPMINGKVFTLYRKFEDSNGINFLSISVDPERDTFKVLQDYSQKFSADNKRWQFARGEAELVNKLVNELKLSAGPGIDDHNTRLTLIDPSGTIIGYYSGLDPEGFQELEQKLTTVLSKENFFTTSN